MQLQHRQETSLSLSLTWQCTRGAFDGTALKRKPDRRKTIKKRLSDGACGKIRTYTVSSHYNWRYLPIVLRKQIKCHLTATLIIQVSDTLRLAAHRRSRWKTYTSMISVMAKWNGIPQSWPVGTRTLNQPVMSRKLLPIELQAIIQSRLL